jgi:hypothetical protein
MPTLPWLVPSGIKRVKGGSEEPLRRPRKRPLIPYLLLAHDAVFHSLCPIAYQDETGFHYGAPEDRSEQLSLGNIDENPNLETILRGEASSDHCPGAAGKRRRARFFHAPSPSSPLKKSYN